MLKGELKERAQLLLDEGKSVPEVGRTLNVLPDTLHKAIGTQRLHQPKNKNPHLAEANPAASTKSERSEQDSTAAMGNATTRPDERLAASMGRLGAASAPIRFAAACDVPRGGVLLAAGLLRHNAAAYQLPNGFYGIPVSFCCWR